MANEAYISASLSFLSGSTRRDLSVWSKAADVATKVLVYSQQSIATSETTIDLGSISALGLCLLVNRDSTNYIEIKTAASGTIIAKMLAGEPCLFRIGSGITAPVAIANTAACLLDILLLSQ